MPSIHDLNLRSGIFEQKQGQLQGSEQYDLLSTQYAIKATLLL